MSPDFPLEQRGKMRAGVRLAAIKGSSRVKFLGMTEKRHVRLALMAPLAVSSLALSGCMSSPTYGTDKTAMEQLAGDVSGAISLAPPKREKIDYNPRPTLVKPTPGQKGVLPAPQDNIVQTASTQWPESPEQRRARIRADASVNFDSPNFKAEVIDDVQTDPVAVKKALAESSSSHPPRWTPGDSGIGAKARRDSINRKLAEGRQGSPTSRRYLSEPPLDYRVAASTAPQNDIGEDEYKKELRQKKMARKKDGGLFSWLPW